MTQAARLYHDNGKAGQSGWESEGWREAAADYHANRTEPRVDQAEFARLEALMRDDVPILAAERMAYAHHFKGRAASSTVEALMYLLRRRGAAALQEKPVQQRLSQLSQQQLREVCGRLQKFKPEIARAWTTGEVDLVTALWDSHHGR